MSVLLSLLLLSVVFGGSNGQERGLNIGVAGTLSEVVDGEPGIGWGTAESIETDNASIAFRPQVAVDSQGNAVAVWSQFGQLVPFRNNILANRFVPGVGWGTAEPIEIGAGNTDSPHVAVDWQGNAVAVWWRGDSTHSDVRASRFVPGVGWGTAELLVTMDVFEVFDSQVAMDPAGNAVVVWQQSDDTLSDIWASRFVPGVGWSTPQLIETDAGFAIHPEVAVDPQGNAVAMWSQWDGTRYAPWANRFVPGVGWGMAELLETGDPDDAFNPQVAVDPEGNAIAVWSQGDGSSIWANRFVPGVGWGTAELLEADVGNARDPQIAVDPQGNAVAVWQQWDGSRISIWANRFVPGVGWGTAELLETDDAGNAVNPQIAVDPEGNALAVWQQSDGNRTNIRTNRFMPGVGWGTAELIETDVDNARDPQIAIDSQGNAVAVWSQGDGTRFNIWANRFEGDIVPPDRAIPPWVIAAGIGAGVAAAVAGVALLLWRRRAGGKDKA